MTETGNKGLFRALILSIVVATGFYVAAMIAGDLKRVSDDFMRFGMTGWVAVLSLSLLNYFLRFARWHLYLKRLGATVPVLMHLIVYVAGFGFATTPGKAGEAIRSVYLRRYSVSYSQSLGALFVERLLDLVAVAILAIAGAWSFPGARIPLLAAVGLLVAALPLVRHPAPQQALAWIARRAQAPRIRGAIQNFASLIRSSAALLTANLLYGSIAIGLVAWAAEGAGLWLIVSRLGGDIPITLALGIYAVAILAGAVSLIPGGLGGTEAVMALLLSARGIEPSTALATTLLCRLATLWFAVILGLAAIAGLSLSRRSSENG